MEEIPLAWTTWDRWRGQYPDSQVLSTDTGYLRSYGKDPYGSYERRRSYYDSGGPFFTVMAQDGRFSPKEVVTGVKVGHARLAIPKGDFRSRRVANTRLATKALAVFYDPALDVVRVYDRKVSDQTLTFRREPGWIVDGQTGSRWTPAGRCIEGSLARTQLRRAESFDVMWFAWYVFFPDTEVLN